MWILIAMLVACTPDDVRGKRPTSTTDSATELTTDTAPTQTDSGTPDDAMCDEPLPPLPGTYVQTTFVTEEDFDFDGGGFLLSQSGAAIAALDHDHNVQIIPVPGFQDPSGLRVLSTGDIALAEPITDALRVVYRDSGASEIVMSGMSFPNGLTADSNGRVFISDFIFNGRIGLADPYTGESWIVLEGLNRPNGLELSPDEQRLFIMTEDGVMVSERLGDTSFSPATLFATVPAGQNPWSLTIDVCGNLYTVDYFSGKVYRISADGSTTELVVDIAQFGAFSSLRFGSGYGGWERETLYVTNRASLFAVPIGVPGRRSVAPVF